MLEGSRAWACRVNVSFFGGLGFRTSGFEVWSVSTLGFKAYTRCGAWFRRCLEFLHKAIKKH